MDTHPAYEAFKKVIWSYYSTPPPEPEWRFYLENMHLAELEKGQFYLQPGDVANTFAFVYSGVLKRFFVTEDGREFITRFDFDGRTSADLAALWQKIPARQHIQAVTPVVLLISSPDLLFTLRDRHPIWHVGGRELAEQRFLEKSNREYEFLCLDAESRYRNFLKQHGAAADKIPQKDVAAYVGVTPSSLNKIINNQKITKTCPKTI